MDTQIPSASDVQLELSDMTHAELQALARTAEVPFTTLWKIKDGTTSNPGIETVRKFNGHIAGIKAQRVKAALPEPEAKAA